jgi:hypothetical protein
MARGWESKAIESQQDDAARARATRRALTAEERERQTRRETLGLALAQSQSELTAACRPAHREMLQMRIGALRTELATLGAPEER